MLKTFYRRPAMIFLFLGSFLGQAEAIPFIYTFQANFHPELVWKVKIDHDADGYILTDSGDKVVPTDVKYGDFQHQAGYDYFYADLLEGPPTDSAPHPTGAPPLTDPGPGDTLFCGVDYADGGGAWIYNYLFLGTYEHPLVIMFMQDFNSIQIGDHADDSITWWDGYSGDQLDIQLKDIAECTVPVPEPATILLLSIGLTGMALSGSKKCRNVKRFSGQ